MAFKPQSPAPVTLFFIKATPLRPTQRGPPTKDEVFKFTGAFSLELYHIHLIFLAFLTLSATSSLNILRKLPELLLLSQPILVLSPLPTPNSLQVP